MKHDDDDDFVDPTLGLNRREKDKKRGRVPEPSLPQKKVKVSADGEDEDEDDEDDAPGREDESEDEAADTVPLPALHSLKYSSEYGSLVIKLLNLGMVKYMKVPMSELIDCGDLQNFNDLLRGNLMLQRVFTSNGKACSLEISLLGKRAFVDFRKIVCKQRIGPFGMFVWINVHNKPTKIIFPVKSIKKRVSHHQFYHGLLGFIYETTTTTSEYRCTVRSWTGWIDAVSLQSISAQDCMEQLSTKAVSLLYGSENLELLVPITRANEETFSLSFDDRNSLARSLNGWDLESYDRFGNKVLSHLRYHQDRDYHAHQWQLFAAHQLNVDYNPDFDMSPQQRDDLRQIIRNGKNSYKDVIHSNGPDSTIHLEGNNFIAKVIFEFRPVVNKLCQYCLHRRYITDAAGNWVCVRHVPNDGSAGIFCVYFYHPSPVQVDQVKVEFSLVANRDAKLGPEFSHSVVCRRYYANSAEEALHTFFVASCLQFTFNVHTGIRNNKETHIRKNLMNSIPKYFETDLADMKKFLGLEIGVKALPPSERVIKFDESLAYGVYFPAEGMRHKHFSYVYVKKYEMDASTSLFYVGKASSRAGPKLCNTKRELGVHIENSIVVQTPDKKLLDTLESAAQLAYCLASILNVEKDGKKVIVANDILVTNGAVLNDTTYFDYVKLIFRHQFGCELILSRCK